MTVPVADLDGELFGDLICEIAVRPVAAPVIPAAAITPPAPVEERSEAQGKSETSSAVRPVLEVLNSQHVALAEEKVRAVFISFLSLTYRSAGSVTVADLAEYLGVTHATVRKHLTPLLRDGADLVDVCRFTGVISLHVAMFNQFRDWTMEPYREEITTNYGERIAAWIFGETYVHPSVLRLIREYSGRW